MSTQSYISERSKYGYILHLSKEQIRALDQNDMATFDKILAAKGMIIRSLRDAKHLLEIDPSLMTIVKAIQDSEKLAEKLLYRKIGSIKRQMCEIQQFNLARRAYRKITKKLPSYLITDETPVLLDQRS